MELLQNPAIQTPAHATAAEDSRQPVIMIVDDEKGPRESLKMILAQDHTVVTACGGGEALEILRTRPIDLVTVDLNMPGIKGDELVGMVRDEFPQIEIIIITGFGTLETAVNGIRRGVCDFLTKPFDVVQVNTAVGRALHRQQGRRRLVRFLDGLGSVLGHDRSADEILNELEQDSELQKRLQALLEEPVLNHGNSASPTLDPRTVEFLELLAETVESRDSVMRGHAQRVAFYTGIVADQLCLGRTLQQQARVAAFLHDLGKAGLPTAVLPEAEVLSGPQRAAVEQHPVIAERLVRPLGLPSAIVDALRHHHERWDGKGYPDGLKGSEISLIARIVAIADAYDAMLCDSSYRPSRTRDEAIEELRAHAGGQFDPTLVETFIEIAESGIHMAPEIELDSSRRKSLTFAEHLTTETRS